MSAAAQTINPKIMNTLEDWIAPESSGENFFDIDASLHDLLSIYMDTKLSDHMTPHFRRLGEVAGTRLDELARMSDDHVPVLHTRDNKGLDRDWIEFHPAYREMEQIGYGDFGIHCMSYKPGVFGWEGKVPPLAKYIFQYLFSQSEFGLLCPISATENSAMLIERYGSETIKEKLLPGMRSQDMSKILKGAQFMTEKSGGSDVSNSELEARLENGEWRLYGEKWFCSCADGDVAVLLARPEGAAGGNAGLALFAMPRQLDDGNRNQYRIARLKKKMGTRSMASGEIIFEGALAYPLGDVGEGINRGLVQMLDMVNMSRLSHGVRAAGMMRRCLNEALYAARGRMAFGEMIVEKPLLRRQLMKIMVPTEQVLSITMFVANQLELADKGDEKAKKLARILTPLLKFRSARDNIDVAIGAMEVRGGNGFIEDWVNPKLVRDALVGVVWEGTANINALDVTNRAIKKAGAHNALQEDLQERLSQDSELPGQFRGELSKFVDQTFAFAEEVAITGNEPMARLAASALYNVTSAVLMAIEGSALGARGGDARRLLLSRMVVDHRLSPADPLAVGKNEEEAIATLLSSEQVDLAKAHALIAG